MEHDYYKTYKEYTANVPEYTVDKVLTVDEMLSYTLNSLNKAMGVDTDGDNE